MSNRFKIDGFVFFNNSLHNAPPLNSKEDAAVVMTDISGSMGGNTNELRVAISGLCALAGWTHRPTVPTPNGGTNIYGAVRQVIESAGFGNRKLILLTDGCDNHHSNCEFQVGITETGDPDVLRLSPGDYNSYDAYLLDRSKAVLSYLEYKKVDVHLIGVGNEVKDLLAMATSSRHVVGVCHIPERATAAQIVGLLGATIKKERGAASGVLTVENLPQVPDSADAFVVAVEQAASTIDVRDCLTADDVKKVFSDAEEAAEVPLSVARDARGAVLWLAKTSIEMQRPIPGATIGGKLDPMFVRHGPDWRLNQLLFHLKQHGVLESTREEAITIELDGKKRTYTKVTCYKTSAIAANLIDALAEDRVWATPTKDLTRGTRKRGRGK